MSWNPNDLVYYGEVIGPSDNPLGANLPVPANHYTDQQFVPLGPMFTGSAMPPVSIGLHEGCPLQAFSYFSPPPPPSPYGMVGGDSFLYPPLAPIPMQDALSPAPDVRSIFDFLRFYYSKSGDDCMSYPAKTYLADEIRRLTNVVDGIPCVGYVGISRSSPLFQKCRGIFMSLGLLNQMKLGKEWAKDVIAGLDALVEFFRVNGRVGDCDPSLSSSFYLQLAS